MSALVVSVNSLSISASSYYCLLVNVSAPSPGAQPASNPAAMLHLPQRSMTGKSLPPSQICYRHLFTSLLLPATLIFFRGAYLISCLFLFLLSSPSHPFLFHHGRRLLTCLSCLFLYRLCPHFGRHRDERRSGDSLSLHAPVLRLRPPEPLGQCDVLGVDHLQ